MPVWGCEVSAHQWLDAKIEAKIAHAETRAFWRGVTAARARYVADNGMYWRQAERRARDAGNKDNADDCGMEAERHEQQAAWLRACAEAP